MATAVIAAPAGATTLAPTADLQVSASVPTANFGAARRLVAERRPRTQAFVRFVLGTPPRPGTTFTLELYPLRSASSGVLLRHASDSPWVEDAITFRTAPRTGPRLVRSDTDHRPVGEFRRQIRDIYVAAGDLAVWQGALHNSDAPEDMPP